jgi:flagellar FliJ protein
MPKFLFNLEGVLRHRKNVEQQRQREVAEVQAQMTHLQAQLRALDAQVQATNDDVRQNRLLGTVDVNFLTAHRRYLLATQKQAVEIAERMAAVQIKLDEARRALIAAATERKVLEKLREKQEFAWRQEMSRKENAALDEVVTQMSYRNGLCES